MKPLSQESRKRLKTCLLYIALPLAIFENVSTIYFLGFVRKPLMLDRELMQVIVVSVAYAVGFSLFIWVLWELIVDRQKAVTQAATEGTSPTQSLDNHSDSQSQQTRKSKSDSPLKTIAIVHFVQALVWSLLVTLLSGTYELNFLYILIFNPVFIGMSLLITGCLWALDKQRSKQRSNPEPEEDSSK